MNTQLIDVKNIHSLTEFKRRAAELVGELKETSRPLVLTVNGRAEAVVLGTDLYRRLVKLIEEADDGRDLRAAGPVEIDFDLDVGFLGLALDGGFAHGSTFIPLDSRPFIRRLAT